MADYNECDAEMDEVAKLLVGTSEDFPNLSWKKVQERWSIGWEESKETDGWDKREGKVTDWTAKSRSRAWGGPVTDIDKELDEKSYCTRVLENIRQDFYLTNVAREDYKGRDTSIDHLDTAAWASVQREYSIGNNRKDLLIRKTYLQ